MVAAALAVLLAASIAEAQTRAPKWEIEGYGGLATNAGSAGTSALPAPGAAILTSSVLFPSRQAPSWFFGDGAAMLNDVTAEFALPDQIAPLDTALRSSGLGGGHASYGVRVRRSLTPRWSAEVSVDIGNGARGISGGLTDALEAARDSFETTFAGLLATGPFTGITIDATNTTTLGSGGDLSVTGAVNVHFGRRGGLTPHATFGGGITSGWGELPSATLQGDYRFNVLGQAPFQETDRVTLRYERSAAAPIFVVGGGVRRDVSDRWGWRIDGRLLAGGGGTRLLIDATPSVAVGTPTGVIESLTNPNLQFSNSASTGRTSTLGGPPVSGFVAFDEGFRTRFSVTFGITRKF